MHDGGDTHKLAVVAVVVPMAVVVSVAAPPVIAVVVAVAAAALARLFQLVSALLRLAAVLAVALDLPLEFRFGLADALDAFVVPVARLRGRGTAEQQEPAQRRREQRGLPKSYLTQHGHLPGNDAGPRLWAELVNLVASY